MATSNPFAPATPIKKYLKILLFGGPGVGKTLAALTFPRCALIDSENGADLYAGRPGVAPFSVLREKTLEGLERAITFIREDKGKTFDTLIIDPLTVFYDVLKTSQIQIQESRGKEMTYREWSKINNRMKALYNTLTMLPVHVVVIAREAIEYEGEGSSLRRVGVKPDIDKNAEYLFDFVVRITEDHKGIVEKSRGYQMTKNLPAVNWSVFEPVANAFVDGEGVTVASDQAAIDLEVASEEQRNKPAPALTPNEQAIKDWYRKTEATYHYSSGQIREALGVERLSDYGDWTDTQIADKASLAVMRYKEDRKFGPPRPISPELKQGLESYNQLMNEPEFAPVGEPPSMVDDTDPPEFADIPPKQKSTNSSAFGDFFQANVAKRGSDWTLADLDAALDVKDAMHTLDWSEFAVVSDAVGKLDKYARTRKTNKAKTDQLPPHPNGTFNKTTIGSKNAVVSATK